MFLRTGSGLVVSLILGGVAPAWADEPPPAPPPEPSPDPLSIDELVAQSEAQAETIEIHDAPPPAAPGATTLGRVEAARIPGTGGDLVRTLTALPGVLNQSQPTGPSGLVIRGSAPQDSKILIDGFEVPLLYHTIGARAILPVEAIDSLDYIPGGFDVSYGRAGSGIVALKTRAGSEQRTAQAELSALDGGVVAQGTAGSTTRYMIAFRRSTIDLILPHVLPSSLDLSLTTVPNYDDLQARLDLALSSHWSLAISALGSLDALEVYATKAENPDKRFFNQTRFLRLTGTARWHDGPWSAELALSAMPEDVRFERGVVQHVAIERIETATRGELSRTWRAAAGLLDVVWRSGGELTVSRDHLDLAIPTPSHDGVKRPMGSNDPNDISTTFDAVVWSPDAGAWTMLSAGFGPRVRVTAGLRTDLFARSGDVAVQPRGQLEI